MALLVRWHVHELNQVVVVQQSLQLVNIAIGRVFKMKVKITNKRKLSACMTVFRNQRWEFFKVRFVWQFVLLAGRYKQITETDVLSWDDRSSTDSNELNGRGCRHSGFKHDCNAATPAADAWERVEEVATRGSSLWCKPCHHWRKAGFLLSAEYQNHHQQLDRLFRWPSGGMTVLK